jgi:acetolactate synthase I/III small subunit
MTHIVSLLVENHQGVLARISGLLSGRGYNVESITAGPTTDPTVTRITLACTGDDSVAEQLKKQLHRLIDVIRVTELTDVPAMHRELMLVKVGARPPQRAELFQMAEVFKAQVMDVGHDTVSLELTGSPEKVDDFLALLLPYGIAEMARSGVVSLERGRKTPGPADGRSDARADGHSETERKEP